MNYILSSFFILLLSLTSTTAMSEEKKAIFAGGCFWCMEKPFEQIPGVKSVVSGYIGGTLKNPTYKQVSSGVSGHYEAVEITYDSEKTNFETLLLVFWQQINPTDMKGQFVDRGQQYAPGIFYLDEDQKTKAEKTKSLLKKANIFKKPINTLITKATKFYTAEDYHQDYYKTNPVRYWYYRKGSGRDDYLTRYWTDKHKKAFKDLIQKAYPDKIGQIKTKADK